MVAKYTMSFSNARIKSVALEDPDVLTHQRDALTAIGEVVSVFSKSLIEDASELDRVLTPAIL